MTTPTVLPALVWDMGGIMYRYFTEVLLEQAAANGWPVDGMPLGPTGAVEDPEYDAMNRGEIDEPGYLAVIRQRFAAAGIDVDPMTAIHWPDQSRPETWAVIRAAHAASHPQGLLTNDASKWLGPNWWETWEPARWFDHLIDVEQVGVRKPAPEPYLAAAAALGLAPVDCLFIDDMIVNCAGAEAVGMSSHHVDIRDVAGSMERLAKRLELDV
jgi:FMN phosphatase YigB (HAD superfamily)